MRALLLESRGLSACLVVSMCLAVLSSTGNAGAQSFETVGTRALGMGGAFVAVADDATAVYWNPAGLANAGVVDTCLQRTSIRAPVGQGEVATGGSGWRTSTTLFAFALPSLGVSYLRTRVQQAYAPTAEPGESRKIDKLGMAAVSSLATDQVGVTLLQSLLANLVAGTTLKFIRGSFAAGAAPPGPLSATLDRADLLGGAAATRFDLDVGVMGFAGPVRFGMTARNLRRPDFSPGDVTGAGRVQRQVRVGVAVTPGFVVNRTAASRPSLTIAVDADLTRSMLPTGDERHVAAGVEGWLLGRRLGLRGGMRASIINARRPVATVGASVGLRSGLLLEGQFARGGEVAGQQWSLGGRVAF